MLGSTGSFRLGRSGITTTPMLEVLVDPAGQQDARTVAHERIGDVTHPFQEVPVVGDDEQRARPLVKVVLDHAQGVDVQIIGRLVQEQHIGLLDEQPQQLQAAPLPTGELTHPGDQSLPAEPELLEKIGSGGLPSGLQASLLLESFHRVQHPFVAVELVHLLGEVGHAQGLAVLDASTGRFDPTVQQVEQGGLPGSVHPDESDTFPRPDRPGEVVEQGTSVGQGEGDVLEVQDVLAQPAGGEASQGEFVTRLGDVGDERVGGLDAELRFGRASRGAAAQPGELLARQV